MLQSIVQRHIAPLVHDTSRHDALERARHETFLVQRIATALIALALVALQLFAGTPPHLAESAVILFLLVPVVAALAVSKTGDLALGQTISTASLAGLAVTAALAGETATALVWLVLLPFDALFGVGATRAAVAGIAGTALALAAATSGPLVAMHPATGTALAASAIAYGAMLAYHVQVLCRLRIRLRDATKARFQTLSEAIGDLVMRHDRNGIVLSASAEAESLFSINPRDLLGRGFFERVHVADRPALLTAIADAAARPATVTVGLRLRTAKEVVRDETYAEPVFAWVELRARRFDEREGASADDGAVISLVRDVTSVKQHEMQLESARAEAERASAWKDRFLANTSHELRTPLNAIIGFSEMLGSVELGPKEPAKQREYADIIHASGQHLLAVVNTILDMSKIEAGSFHIDPQAFDLAPLIDACCDMVRLKATERHVEIVRDVPKGLDELVADKRACRQILINLISNAVKFTPAKGRVTVSVRIDGNCLLIAVEDTGIGIAARDLPRLGDPFFQAHSTNDRAYEGTGLGLSVVRGLVGLHGGSMAIESAAGVGTRVVVRLPGDCRRFANSANQPAKIETISRYVRAGHAPAPPRMEGQKLA